MPAYGMPRSLAALVRARATFFGGACVAAADRTGDVDEAAYTGPQDFYAVYHVPFFASWAVCERAALHAQHGDRAGAGALLKTIAERAPNRSWLLKALQRYQP
jgi:hypothetical protein